MSPNNEERLTKYIVGKIYFSSLLRNKFHQPSFSQKNEEISPWMRKKFSEEINGLLYASEIIRVFGKESCTLPPQQKRDGGGNHGVRRQKILRSQLILAYQQEDGGGEGQKEPVGRDVMR
jgi:hypothetical protein